MEIHLKQGNIIEEAVDLIVVSLFQGVTEPDGAVGVVEGPLQGVDRALGGAIRELIGAGDLTGKTGPRREFS
jgi:leucyl aminopeptidase